MEIQTRWLEQDVLVIRPEGRLDDQTSDSFFHMTESLVAGADAKVIIDCSALTFVSSLGLATMIRFHTRLKREHGEVKLAALGQFFQKLLVVVGLHRVFAAYADVETAHRAFIKL